MKHSKSVENLKNLSNSQECMLLVGELAKIPFLNYLNLIDIEGKKYRDKEWTEIPNSVSEIVSYSNYEMLNEYKILLLDKIDNSDLNELPCLIRKLLKVAKIIHSLVTTTNSQYKTILHCLLERVSKDSSLLPTVWRALSVSDQFKVDIFSEFITNHEKYKSAELLENIIKVALDDFFNIWNVCNKNHERYGFHCPVTEALFRGEYKKMNVLVKYGFELNSQRLNTYDSYLIIYYHTYKWLREHLVGNTSPRKKIVFETLLFMVILALSTKSKQTNMIQCYLLLWEVIPNPYVTKTELDDEVQWLFLTPPEHSYFPRSKSDFMLLFFIYEKYILQDEGALLQPRSLKHLCKCKIRKELQKSWTLPVGIYKLPLPENLQRYLDVSFDGM